MRAMPRAVLRRYKSKCRLAFKGDITLAAYCDISLSEDGDARIECDIPTFADIGKIRKIQEENHLVYTSLVGEETHGFAVSAPKAYLLSMSGGTKGCKVTFAPAEPLRISKRQATTEHVEVYYGLANFYFGGCEVTHTGTGWKVDKFRVTVQTLDLLFRQLDDYEHRIAVLKEEGGIMQTSELIVRLGQDKLEELDKTVFDVLVLLSYATGSWIGIVYRDVFEGTNLVESRFGASKMFPYRHFDFVIDARNLSGCQLRQFAERAFPIFLSLKHSLSLDAVLEYATTAKLGSHLDTKYILTSLVLETLASCIPDHMRKLGIVLQSGALNAARARIAEILNKRGLDMSPQVIDEIADRVAYKGIGLKDRLRALLNHYHIPYDTSDFDFTRTRARLVHSGRFDDYNEAITLYQRLTDFVNRVLLSLLGCQGIPYVNAAKGHTEQPVPPLVE